MQRREFSRSLLAAGAAAGGFSALAPAWAQRLFQQGSDYTLLSRPVPVTSAPGQVEVIEFFAYSCIHCFRFEPVFNPWLAKLPPDVKVRRMHVAFNQAFVPLQRLYFTLEAMGLVDSLHEKVFKAFHEEHIQLTTPPAILDWVVKQGVDGSKFSSVYNGQAVLKAAAQATQLQDAYEVDGTPALGVAGRYYVSGQGPRTLQIADYLIVQARKA